MAALHVTVEHRQLDR